MGRELPTGTVTFLFTDIEGSTALVKRLGDVYVGVLGAHDRILRKAASEQGGREIDNQGESFFFACGPAFEITDQQCDDGDDPTSSCNDKGDDLFVHGFLDA